MIVGAKGNTLIAISVEVSCNALRSRFAELSKICVNLGYLWTGRGPEMHYKSCGTRPQQLREEARALPGIGKVLRGTNASGLLRYLYGPAVLMSTPIRTWWLDSLIRQSWSRNAAPADHRICAAWRGCWPSRWPCWAAAAVTSLCGTARCVQHPKTGDCQMRSGRMWRPGSCTAQG